MNKSIQESVNDTKAIKNDIANNDIKIGCKYFILFITNIMY